MVSVYNLKPRFQNVLRPLIERMAKAGFTPNIVTLSALFGSILLGGILSYWSASRLILLLLPVWLFIRMALNAIDGMMAREHQMSSKLGAILNEAGDILSDIALYLPLAWRHYDIFWPVLLFTLGAVLTELCGLFTRAIGASRRYDGPMGKSDRALFVGALALFTNIFSIDYFWWRPIFFLGALLTAVTCILRVRGGLIEREASSSDSEAVE